MDNKHKCKTSFRTDLKQNCVIRINSRDILIEFSEQKLINKFFGNLTLLASGGGESFPTAALFTNWMKIFIFILFVKAYTFSQAIPIVKAQLLARHVSKLTPPI